MYKNYKLRELPSILEMVVIMMVLMGGCVYVLNLFSDQLSVIQIQLITVFFAALTSAIVLSFIIQKHKDINDGLLMEVKVLKKMEEELKNKVDELVKFKDLILWWEKKVGDIEKDMNSLKEKLAK